MEEIHSCAFDPSTESIIGKTLGTDQNNGEITRGG